MLTSVSNVLWYNLRMNELLNKQLNTKRKAKGVKPDVQAGVSYNADLQRIVRQINKDVKHVVKLAEPPGYVRDSWVDTLSNQIANIRTRWTSSAFNAFANQIATKFVQTSNRTNARKNGTDFGINVYSESPELVDNLRLSVAANVSLIESIPEQYLTQVESIVMSNARAGNRPSVISKQLVKQFGITERRAKMIARDQTAKLNGDLNRIRQTDAGFPYFFWSTSNDERVRDRHDDIADHVTQYGKGVYRWDNPPLSSEGVPIIPGSDYSCRCIARPVSQEEVDENIRKGLTNPGVKR